MKKLCSMVVLAFLSLSVANAGWWGYGPYFHYDTSGDGIMEGYGMGARIDYTIVKWLRVDVILSSTMKNDKDYSSISFTPHVNFLFPVGPFIHLYPLAGWGYNWITYSGPYVSFHDDTLLLDLGGGVDFHIGEITLNAEIKLATNGYTKVDTPLIFSIGALLPF